MHVVLTGSNGQTGSFLRETFQSFFPDAKLTSLTDLELDLSETPKIKSTLQALGPIDGIINAAAYTAVDLAEKEQDLAQRVNADAVREIAEFARENDIWVLHFSTDYVYEGAGSYPQTETTPIHPLNHYGKTKAAGDAYLAEIAPRHLIFRTSWVYSERGKNFLLTMLKLFSEKTELSIVCDQWGAPTYARDLAEESLKALAVALSEPRFPSGLYHLTNAGSCSWFDFAEAILDHLENTGATLKIRDLLSIPSSQYPTAAKRPLNSRLSLERFKKTFGFEPRAWRDALTECMGSVCV